ncbi:MAG: hypothetical protein ACOC0U_06655 [Desulfovibrionales bacterium]
MHRLRGYLQHHMNPLHVYCRLRKIGFMVPVAYRMTGYYERFFYRFWL